MPGAELVAWAFRSPRRLAAVVLVPVVAVVVLGIWSQRAPDAAGAPSATAAPAASGRATVGGARVPDAQPFVTAAVRFVTQWAAVRDGETPEQWHQRVAALSTSDLAAALQLTDPASLPGGAPSGEPEVRFVSRSSALIAVPLSSGGAVVVTVVQDSGRWRVSDVQPDVGDAGATP